MAVHKVRSSGVVPDYLGDGLPMSTLQEHYLLPIKLTVTKLSGLGEDTLFIAVLEVLQSVLSPFPGSSPRMRCPASTLCST